jgi:adenosylcobinamide kinase / adenosylcobinamide-phosphate guanylyltransferase
MALSVLLGGARSGKSALAVRRALAYDGPVTFVATATAGDDEMAARIARHRDERPSGWQTVEAPLALDAALESAPADALVIVDCLTLWVSSRLERGDSDAEVERQATNAARVAAGRGAPTIAVSNEVGLGIVPAAAAVRRFRDVHGRVNGIWVAHAAQASLVVAGALLPLTVEAPAQPLALTPPLTREAPATVDVPAQPLAAEEPPIVGAPASIAEAE